MEGWLYGLFALVGVIAGGLFTYLGMRKQLKQQSELDSRHWRRDVRGEPLLKLRNELARMATKQNRLVDAASRQHTSLLGGTDEENKLHSKEIKDELEEATNEWKTYIKSGGLAHVLFVQYNVDLVRKVTEIQEDFETSRFYHLYLYNSQTDVKKFTEALETFDKNRYKIPEAQELINKRLEEL